MAPAARRSVPALMVVLPLMNWGDSTKIEPGRALVRPAVPVMAEVTVTAWPEATWKIASVPPKATIGTARVEPVPVPLARIAPLLIVRVAGFRPPRPPTERTCEASLVSAKALMVCAPVSELAFKRVAW